MTHVIAGGDAHFPFSNYRTINKFISYIETTKPDAVVLLGDIVDFYHI